MAVVGEYGAQLPHLQTRHSFQIDKVARAEESGKAKGRIF